jgi:LmbE family N-acetylglucosaminyl deacetylase
MASPRSRRRWPWFALGAVLGAIAWIAWRFGPNVPIYLANMRLRAALDPLDMDALGSRLLIVAPHPDDETLGPGGLIQRALADGRQVFVVMMTNGDGFEHERARLLAGDVVYGTGPEHQRLGKRRQQETLRAMALIGVPKDRVFFLGYPDGGVHEMWQPAHWSLDQPSRSPRTCCDHNPYALSYSHGRPYSGASALSDLVQLFEQVHPTAVFTTGPFDVQRDHWATYGFVKAALTQIAERDGLSIPLYAFLIHRHDWPAPQGYFPEHPLEPPAAWTRMRGVHWRRVDLTPEQVALKYRCLGEYRSQDAAHVTELTSFVRRNELFALIDDPPPGPEMIPDPVADLPPDRVSPAEDVVWVGLMPEGQRDRLSLHLVSRPDPNLSYAIVWHNVRAESVDAGSVIWHGGKATVYESAERGVVKRTPAGRLASGQSLVIYVPSAALPGPRFLLEGYSQRESKYADHTMTLAFSAPSAPFPQAVGRTGGGGSLPRFAEAVLRCL